MLGFLLLRAVVKVDNEAVKRRRSVACLAVSRLWMRDVRSPKEGIAKAEVVAERAATRGRTTLNFIVKELEPTGTSTEGELQDTMVKSECEEEDVGC